MFYKVIQCQTLMDSTDRNNSPNRRKKIRYISPNTEHYKFIINKAMSLRGRKHSPGTRETVSDLLYWFLLPETP